MSTSNTLTLHHLENSRSQRVLWLLEELGLPYTVKHYRRDPKTSLAPPELLRVHPLGKSPVLTDGDVTVAESGAIVEYLIDRHGQGRLRPGRGTAGELLYRYWLHFAEGSAMPPLVMKLVFHKVVQKAPFLVKPIAKGIAAAVEQNFIGPNLKRQLDHMEAELGRRAWFAGDEFSAADIQMSFPVEAARAAGLVDAAKRPKLADWLNRIHARAAYRRAIEVGGPFVLEAR